ACFYRGDEEACREQLDAIEAESTAARLVPALLTMLGAKSSTPLTAAATALISQVTVNMAPFCQALELLERAFAKGPEGSILVAIRPVVGESRQTAPEQLDRLKQHISVHCAVAGMDREAATKALGGPARHDAYFFRLFARASEQTGDPE